MKSAILLVAFFAATAIATGAWVARRGAATTAEWKARVSILNAKVAEAETQRRVDSVTVIRQVTRVAYKRDTLLSTFSDTLKVKEYIYQTDTLMVACMACVISAARQKAASDALLRSAYVERDAWKQVAESQRRKKNLAERAWPVALVGGVLLGAWVRGQE